MRIPLFLLPQAATLPLARRLKGVGDRLARYYPGLRYDLKLLKSDLDEGEYIIVALQNALAWTVLILLLMVGLYAAQGKVTKEVLARSLSSAPALADTLWRIRLALLPALAAFFVFLGAFLYYPRVMVRKVVEAIDKDLVFALKDLLVQVSSGISLYNAMANIARAGYGRVSSEFGATVQDISAGESQERALEKMALRTESEFLKRTAWQMVTVLRTGASVRGALAALVTNLSQQQAASIKAFIQELNLWILLYVIVGIAIPSLGATLLVVLSLFSGSAVQESALVLLVSACLAAEIALIEYVRVKRPAIHG
ncbi:MAG: type II secretion system F family protein [Candidatus Micrarchaeia archaeon]